MRLHLMLILSASLLLTACSKVNQDNYAKLEAGMSKAAVESLLGKASECSGAVGMSSCTWGDEKTSISVQFAGDAVLMFSGKGLQ
jgi:hypothetical protein